MLSLGHRVIQMTSVVCPSVYGFTRQSKNDQGLIHNSCGHLQRVDVVLTLHETKLISAYKDRPGGRFIEVLFVGIIIVSFYRIRYIGPTYFPETFPLSCFYG